MANILCFEKSKKSALKRLSFLPRIGVVIDFGGRQLVYRQAPLLETLVNLVGRGISAKNLMDVSFKQLKEIELPKVKNFPCGDAQRQKSAQGRG